MLIKPEYILKQLYYNLEPFLTKGLRKLELKQDTIEVTVDPDNLIFFANILRLHSPLKFKCLIDIAVIDNLVIKNKITQKRFYLQYLLTSLLYNYRVALCTSSEINRAIPSLTSLFRSANWIEREIWDLFGIFFLAHPDLRRILTDYGFRGHPLRKDFPVTGFQEINYNINVKLIEYTPIELSQDLRLNSFSNPWLSKTFNLKFSQLEIIPEEELHHCNFD